MVKEVSTILPSLNQFLSTTNEIFVTLACLQFRARRSFKCARIEVEYAGLPVLLKMHLFQLFFKIAWWLIPLLLVNPFHDSLWRLVTKYLHLNPAASDRASLVDALRSEYNGLGRLVDEKNNLISPLSRNMHLGSSTMDEIITIIRGSSIDGADALARTLFQLSTDATAIGKDLQEYSASIDSTVDE